MSERFWARVDKTNGCWIWKGATLKGHPGLVMIGTRSARAPRWAYELTYGAIPKGKVVERTCITMLCVRPDHLRLAGGRAPTEERFWSYVRKTPSCWLWQGTLMPSGHGTLHIGGRDGRHYLAHRLSWEMHYGPIPEGLYVCHNCPLGDNPACVRPDHLMLGTPDFNQKDMARKGRAAKGTEKKGTLLNEAKVLEARRRAAAWGWPNVTSRRGSKDSFAQIARDFGVSEATIRDAVQRKTWTHID